MTTVMNPRAVRKAAVFIQALADAERYNRFTLAIPEEGLPFGDGFAVHRAPDGTLGLGVVTPAPDNAPHLTPKKGETWRTLTGARSSDPECWTNAQAGHLVTIVDEEDSEGDLFVRSLETGETGWVLRAFLAPVEA